MALIKTYARIKPTVKPSKLLDHESTNVAISVPQLQPSGQTRDRTATLTHQFGFAGVFGPTSTQDEVFDLVASHIVDGFLSGYNGTIFAYGQTGSGKTHTIEGGAKSYSDRGLTPRALSRIYKSLANQKFAELSIKVSYLEIYQEVGYDLLNPTTRPGNVVTHLPKVTVTDGPNNSCIVRNLSMHLAADERVAQSLLLQGQASRKVAETPMNQRSSRSHAVFTIYVKARQKGSHAVNKSKLHLVDLAGSERVAKTKIAGQQLHEAKSINLSLHHLEGVIIALQGGHGEGSRVKGRRRALSAGPVRNRRIGSASSTRSLPYHRSMSMGGHRHVPYRNSLLTMVLRDSLGGNCLTAMIATISAEDINLGESLSTCRFAMRVAAVQNKISRNEVIDDRTIIARLRKKIANLEEEILALKSRVREGDHLKEPTPHHHQSDSTTPVSPSLTPSMKAPSSLADTPKPVVAPANGSGLSREGRQLCARIMQGFVSGRVTDPVASGVSDFSRFRECLRILREMIHRSYAYHQRYNPTLLADQQVGSKVKRSEEHVPDVERSPEGGKVKSRSSNEKGHSRGYKSPFERKREKEISKLGKNVQTQITEQKQQRRDLMEFKTLLKQQQLENALRDLSNKISTTSSHLEKQQELVENLRQYKASREQITAERIAQKQLAKKLAKYEKRYQLAVEHLQIVQNHMELQDRVSKARQSTNQNSYTREGLIINQSDARMDPSSQLETTVHPTGQVSSPFDQSEVVLDSSGVEVDQSGSLTDRIVERCRHKSGRVDSRRVLDILKQEDGKHNKVAKEIKKERIKNFTQHFALKEEATLTKLQHFKEQLRRQQEDEKRRSDSSLSMTQSWDGHVNTAWSEDRKAGRSPTGQLDASKSDPASGMRRSCESHVNTAWSDDVKTDRSMVGQSVALVPTVNESDFAIDAGQTEIDGKHANNGPMRFHGRLVSPKSQMQTTPHQKTSTSVHQRSSKESSLDRLSPKNNNMATEPNSGATVVADLHAFNEWHDRSPPGRTLELPMAKTAVTTKDSISQGADADSVHASSVTLGSVQSSLSPSMSTLRSSPIVGDAASSSLGEGSTMFNQDSRISSENSRSSSTLGLSLQDGPAAGHSADSLFHKTSRLPEQPLGQTMTDPRRSSFDAALSSMLHPNRSKVNPAVQEVEKPKTQNYGDVTAALKSKLLDYLGGEPSRAISSMDSLQDDCSGSSINSGFTRSSMLSDAFGRSSVRSAFEGSSVNSAFEGSSVNSGFTGSSSSSVVERSSVKSAITGSSIGSASREPSVNSSFAEFSINSAFERSSLNTALERFSVTTALTGSSSNGAFPRTDDITSLQTAHTPLEGKGMTSKTITSSKPPTFQIGASSSTLNSIGEEESIIARGEDEVDRDVFVRSEVKAMEEAEGQRSYLSAARANKERIEKIRKAMRSAEVIQRAWKKYRNQKK
eukprot:XP_011673232.1 PREDICTED: uncharacterized protein LOC763216 [Strongylocentrotus purpuratus]